MATAAQRGSHATSPVSLSQATAVDASVSKGKTQAVFFLRFFWALGFPGGIGCGLKAFCQRIDCELFRLPGGMGCGLSALVSPAWANTAVLDCASASSIARTAAATNIHAFMCRSPPSLSTAATSLRRPEGTLDVR